MTSHHLLKRSHLICSHFLLTRPRSWESRAELQDELELETATQPEPGKGSFSNQPCVQQDGGWRDTYERGRRRAEYICLNQFLCSENDKQPRWLRTGICCLHALRSWGVAGPSPLVASGGLLQSTSSFCFLGWWQQSSGVLRSSSLWDSVSQAAWS